MTLSQANQSRSLFQRFLRSLAEPGFQDENILVECRKAAEQGVPLAQVALAQMTGAQRRLQGSDAGLHVVSDCE